MNLFGFFQYIFFKQKNGFLSHVDMIANVTGQMMCSSHGHVCTRHMAHTYVCACVRDCS